MFPMPPTVPPPLPPCPDDILLTVFESFLVFSSYLCKVSPRELLFGSQDAAVPTDVPAVEEISITYEYCKGAVPVWISLLLPGSDDRYQLKAEPLALTLKPVYHFSS